MWKKSDSNIFQWLEYKNLDPKSNIQVISLQKQSTVILNEHSNQQEALDQQVISIEFKCGAEHIVEALLQNVTKAAPIQFRYLKTDLPDEPLTKTKYGTYCNRIIVNVIANQLLEAELEAYYKYLELSRILPPDIIEDLRKQAHHRKPTEAELNFYKNLTHLSSENFSELFELAKQSKFENNANMLWDLAEFCLFSGLYEQRIECLSAIGEYSNFHQQAQEELVSAWLADLHPSKLNRTNLAGVIKHLANCKDNNIIDHIKYITMFYLGKNQLEDLNPIFACFNPDHPENQDPNEWQAYYLADLLDHCKSIQQENTALRQQLEDTKRQLEDSNKQLNEPVAQSSSSSRAKLKM